MMAAFIVAAFLGGILTGLWLALIASAWLGQPDDLEADVWRRRYFDLATRLTALPSEVEGEDVGEHV